MKINNFLELLIMTEKYSYTNNLKIIMFILFCHNKMFKEKIVYFHYI